MADRRNDGISAGRMQGIPQVSVTIDPKDSKTPWWDRHPIQSAGDHATGNRRRHAGPRWCHPVRSSCDERWRATGGSSGNQRAFG